MALPWRLHAAPGHGARSGGELGSGGVSPLLDSDLGFCTECSAERLWDLFPLAIVVYLEASMFCPFVMLAFRARGTFCQEEKVSS